MPQRGRRLPRAVFRRLVSRSPGGGAEFCPALVRAKVVISLSRVFAGWVFGEATGQRDKPKRAFDDRLGGGRVRLQVSPIQGCGRLEVRDPPPYVRPRHRHGAILGRNGTARSLSARANPTITPFPDYQIHRLASQGLMLLPDLFRPVQHDDDRRRRLRGGGRLRARNQKALPIRRHRVRVKAFKKRLTDPVSNRSRSVPASNVGPFALTSTATSLPPLGWSI